MKTQKPNIPQKIDQFYKSISQLVNGYYSRPGKWVRSGQICVGLTGFESKLDSSQNWVILIRVKNVFGQSGLLVGLGCVRVTIFFT